MIQNPSSPRLKTRAFGRTYPKNLQSPLSHYGYTLKPAPHRPKADGSDTRIWNHTVFYCTSENLSILTLRSDEPHNFPCAPLLDRDGTQRGPRKPPSNYER